MDRIEILEKRLTRERRARKEAESLLETKSFELYEVNKALTAASQAKSEFLANVSHELRTPMNGVLGMAGLLLRSDLTQQQRNQAEKIQQSGEALLHLLNNILDLSKIEAGHVELETVDFDLDQVVGGATGVMESRAQQKGLKLSYDIHPDVPLNLKGDYLRLQQILYNLIGNAIKFTEEGRIEVRLTCPTSAEAKTKIRFEVSDTGIGIHEEAIASIFDSFSQADSSTTRLYGGTGLGLSICKQLVESLGGEIGVASTVGVGSTFWFTIACERGTGARPSTDGDPPAEVDTSVGRPLRILVADDNVVNQEVIAMTLEYDGHSVICVSNGAEAVKAVQQTAYDVVLMDIQMPEMDGLVATKQIRALPGDVANIPIMALTANAMVGDRESYLAAGMDEYASKPVDSTEILGKIRTLVAGS